MNALFSHCLRVSVSGLVLAACGLAGAESTPLDLNISAATFSEWGGKRIVGEVVEQGENNGHVKVTFRPAENAQHKEMGVMLTPELPEFNKVTMEVFSNVDAIVRVRLGDASDDAFVVNLNVAAGSWTPLEFVFDAKSGKNWPPKAPYRSLVIRAAVASGVEEQILEVKNVQLIKE